MAGLEAITRFEISGVALDYAWNFMAEMGRQGYEGLVFFAGKLDGNLAFLTEAYVPEQKAYKTAHGLLVHVESEALHRFNAQLYEHSLRFIAQIHSHGESAYHSKTDDEHSMITVLGGLSIVVPHFASSPFSLSTCAFYRRTRDGWQELSDFEKETSIRVVR
jgi:hypothetical protein